MNLEIKQISDILDIEDTGDYEEEFSIPDITSKYLYLKNETLVETQKQIGEEDICDFRELSGYTRNRAVLKNCSSIPNEDYEWFDLLGSADIDIFSRLNNLQFSDFCNILSGKISDSDLAELSNPIPGQGHVHTSILDAHLKALEDIRIE